MCRHDLEYSRETCEMADTVSPEAEPVEKVLSDRLIELADEVCALEQSEGWYFRRCQEQVSEHKQEKDRLMAKLDRTEAALRTKEDHLRMSERDAAARGWLALGLLLALLGLVVSTREVLLR